MYFLNGDRIYINPGHGCSTRAEQLQSCLAKLAKINSGNKIFKLNFFVDTVSNADYLQLQQSIQNEVKLNFADELLLSLIAQPPLASKILIEACFFNPTLWKTSFYLKNNDGAVLFQNETAKVLIGNVQSNLNVDCKTNSEEAFSNLDSIFRYFKFPVNSIVRQWNYIEDILGFDGLGQRYQAFNNARSSFYRTEFEKSGYPAATGIGMNKGGIIIEFIAVSSEFCKSLPINNPSQVAAHAYSEKVLAGRGCVIKTTPKFERARYLELAGNKLIFISGTASIEGEQTVGINNPAKQTEVTINNIKQLYSKPILETVSDKNLIPSYGHARVYVKNRKDFTVVRRTFRRHLGKLPVVFIVADICREELLVEIEGKVILE